MTTFADIVGHPAQKEYLERVLAEQTLVHAYCFSGPKSVGKMAVAERLVEALEQTQAALDEHETPSNSPLVKGRDAVNPDFWLIKRLIDEKTEKIKQNISIDQIRELRQRLSMSAVGKGKKIAIIEEADKMTVAAQNALLKTLEEPAGDTLMILIAQDAEKLLPTILSRTVHLRFFRTEREQICDYLKGKGLDRNLAHQLAGAAQGSPGVAIQLLDRGMQVEFNEKLESAINFINSPLAERFTEVEKMAKSKLDRGEVNDQLSLWRALLHDCLLTSVGAEDMIAFSAQGDQISQISQSKNSQNWIRALRALSEAQTSINKNGNLNISLEHFALSL